MVSASAAKYSLSEQTKRDLNGLLKNYLHAAIATLE